MPPIEIRQNKKTLIPVLAIIFLFQIGMDYYAFFSGELDEMPVMKLVIAFISALPLIGIYFNVRKFIKNEPVLTISTSDITIHGNGKPVSFLWIQVHNWKVEFESDGGTPFLVIETVREKKRISIDHLEKDYEEIEELIITYSGKAPRV